MPVRTEIGSWNATLTVDDIGNVAGRTVMFLHSEEGPSASAIFSDLMGRQARVIAPHHPGFGGGPRVEGADRPGDLAYAYLEVLDGVTEGKVDIVGSSLGGWVALEMAAMHPSRFSSIALVSPLGLKFSSPTEPSYAEVLVAAPDTIRERLYADSSKDPWAGVTDPDDVLRRAEGRESFLHYTWEPYMHNPLLKSLLGRIKVPTLIVAGSEDRFVESDVYADLVEKLPDATLQQIAGAGHYPEIEQPEATAAAINAFLSR